jgi:hypothetical protein
MRRKGTGKSTAHIRARQKYTLSDLESLLALAGNNVVEILPDGEVKVLDTDPAVAEAFNAGLERAARWHMGKTRGGHLSERGVRLHKAFAASIRELKRK